MLSPIDFITQNRTKMNCKETLMDVVTAIEAYPFSGVSSIRTMNIHRKHVDENGLGLDVSGMKEVPFKPKSCSVSENDSMDISGDSHEVTVSWETRQVDRNTYEVLEFLKETSNHLILRAYGKNGYFIRCEENGYEFSYIEKDGVIKCKAVFHNCSGVQRIF